MNKLYTLFLSMAVSLFLFSCQGIEPEPEPQAPQTPETPAQPREQFDPTAMLVDGENYTMFGYEITGCPIDYFPSDDGIRHPNWVSLADTVNHGSYALIMRIDDEETMKQHYRLDYEPIDWTNKTLVLAYGRRLHYDYPVVAFFDDKGNNNYHVSVEIQSSMACAISYWRVAILVDKLDADAVIEIETPDYDYYLH